MRIAVDNRVLGVVNADLRSFTKEVFTRLALQHPSSTFILFHNDKAIDTSSLPANIVLVRIAADSTSFLSLKWWYDFRLFLALKKNAADLFIASNGITSRSIKIPQILIIRDLPLLRNISYFPKGSFAFYKKYLKAFVKKAAAIITVSDFVKDQITAHFGLSKDSILNIGSGANKLFKPIDWTERELIKDKFSKGFEYFVFYGNHNTASHLYTVLKAFSIFKKWQRTNLKLVITVDADAAMEKALERVESYKYRNEVIIIKGLPVSELAKLVAASYAVIYVTSYEGFATPVLESLFCYVPIITPRHKVIQEIAAEAALYIDNLKPEELAEQMKKIFKDEAIRSKLIEAAKMRVNFYGWDKTASLMWTVIEKAVSK